MPKTTRKSLPNLTAKEKRSILERYQAGVTRGQIARDLGRSLTTVSRTLKGFGIGPGKGDEKQDQDEGWPSDPEMALSNWLASMEAWRHPVVFDTGEDCTVVKRTMKDLVQV